MKFKSIIGILICLSIVFFASPIVNMAYTSPDSHNESDINVITQSDAGGGDLSGKELAAIIFISLMVTIIVIVAIVV
jgi:hypothetical protein